MHKLLIGLILMMLCGCATPGSFSVLDLDFRTKEQFEGAAILAQAKHQKQQDAEQLAIGPETVTIWARFMEFLGIARGRMRFGTITWGDVE